jgi:hypothetical protein
VVSDCNTIIFSQNSSQFCLQEHTHTHNIVQPHANQSDISSVSENSCILGYDTMLLGEWLLKAVCSFTASETTYSAKWHTSLISHPLCNITEKLTCKLGWYVRRPSSQSVTYFFFQSLFSALLLLLYR